jgi:cation transport ATPase
MPQDPAQGTPPPSGTPGVPPGTFELYVIILGVFLGIVLGPAVLGRFSPDSYDKFIVQRAGQPQSLAEFEDETLKQQTLLQATQATPVAVSEYLASRQAQRARIMNDDQTEQIRAQLRGLSRSVALIMTILVIMVLESVIDPVWRLARARLQAARYLLISFWLALTLAQPVFLVGFPLAFFFAMILLISISVLLSSWIEERARVRAVRERSVSSISDDGK